MSGDDSDDNAEINIFANEPLKDGKEEVLYGCSVFFDKKEFAITQEIEGVSHDMVPSLEFIAGEVKDLLVELTQDWEPSHRDFIFVEYFSNPFKMVLSGRRGYTCGGDSYLVRALTDAEMKKFIREVDSKVRPLFYEDGE